MDSFSGGFGSGDRPSTRTGPPWEHPGPIFQRYIDTAKGVLLDPGTTFGNMRREGGLGAPLTYGMLGLVIGIIASALTQFMMPTMGPRMGGDVAAGAGGLVFSLVLAPVFAIIGLFLGSAIIHLILMLVGGAKFGYETTFRVIAYTNGSTGPIGIIPICGGLIGAVWGIVCAIIGLAQAHETSTGKAAVAVLTPIVICCVIATIFAVMFAALAASFLSNMQS